MVGSFADAEDLVQETFLRAWRKRASFEGRSTFRAWLYGIATNACLEMLRRQPWRLLPNLVAPGNTPSDELPPVTDVGWLQPYPDRLLDEVAPSEAEPDAVVVAKETIELAFLATSQLLPPRQRAVLILRDVLGWSANDTASALGTSVPAVNSALQRARSTLHEHHPDRLDMTPPPDPTGTASERCSCASSTPTIEPTSPRSWSSYATTSASPCHPPSGGSTGATRSPRPTSWASPAASPATGNGCPPAPTANPPPPATAGGRPDRSIAPSRSRFCASKTAP
jgi:RNA polymerase sigma factor (sigma-70 family)